MNKYKYKAINDIGKTIRGTMSAENPAELEVILKDTDLHLISYGVDRGSSFLASSLTAKEMITMFSHLEQLEKAGISIVDAIVDVKESSESSRTRSLMQEVHESLKNGSMLSEAFAKHSKVFSTVFIGLIANGEKTGNLHSAFNSIIDHLKWTSEMKRKTVKAIRYPLFSLFIMFMVLGVMTTFVVPKVTEFLGAQDIELPGITIALIAFSEFIQNNGFSIIGGIPIIIVTYKLLRKFPNIAVKFDEAKLHIPLFGGIINKIDSSRFCHFFAVTFKSGLGVLECLDAAKEVVNNMAMKQSIEIIKQKVTDGTSLAKSIESTNRFPSLVVRMFDIGEVSGNMEASLNNIRFFYDQEINDSIDNMVGMIQPTLTLVMGGMMAWITIAVFGPIYSTFGNL